MSTNALDPVQAMLAQTSLENTLFAANSRYYGVEVATLVRAGKPVAYLRRRFVPAPEAFQAVQVHVVVQGDRLDNLAGQYLGDPTLFWQLCDANRALLPEELTEQSGRELVIALPAGITGARL
jgi:hypothetical protein